MNALIKVLITAVLGLFGPMEIEEARVLQHEELHQLMDKNQYENNGMYICQFNENPFKMLKSEFPS